MKVDIITLPDQSTLDRNRRADWVCYYCGGAKYAKEFNELLKKSGITTLGASNYANNRKVYYVTKFGGVFSIDKKEFNETKSNMLSFARFAADSIIKSRGGQTLEENINSSYEITF